MLKLPTLILGLSVFHVCLAEDSNLLKKEERRHLGQAPGEHKNLLDSKRDVRMARLLTVDAAVGLYSEGIMQVYLFIGNEVHLLKDTKFVEVKPRKDFHLPDDMHLQAAFARQGNQDNRVYYGDTYGKSVSVLRGVKVKKLKYGSARAFIRDGGPDAAGRRAGKVYVFKGCQMVVRNSWKDWGKPVNVTTIGLPCDLDAAWNEKDKMVLLKGSTIWFWNEDSSVTGPYPFLRYYTLKIGDLLAMKY